MKQEVSETEIGSGSGFTHIFHQFLPINEFYHSRYVSSVVQDLILVYAINENFSSRRKKVIHKKPSTGDDDAPHTNTRSTSVAEKTKHDEI